MPTPGPSVPAPDRTGAPGVDLLWIPLGAGAHVVRVSGRLFERAAAALARRPACDLYHSALVVELPGSRHTIEMTPVPAGTDDRGVVAGGAVGDVRLGRLRVFRYEVRCWDGGVIPDAGHAVQSPVRVLEGAAGAARVIELAPRVPTPVWGRHELVRGDMWNSNSVVSWLLARAGADVDAIRPPTGGRAPGWDAGLVAARREP